MEVFCLKLLVFLLCTCISAVLKGWVGMVSCYSSTFVVSKMCRKRRECLFFLLPSPPLPTLSSLLKNVFVIILLVVRVAVPTTTAVVVAVS